jgi:hypothetical protein
VSVREVFNGCQLDVYLMSVSERFIGWKLESCVMDVS